MQVTGWDSNKIKVLVVDDEQSLLIPLCEYLRGAEYSVDGVENGEKALEKLKSRTGDYDVALIDQMLSPKPDGIQLMKKIKELYSHIECILLTGWGLEHRQRALQEGAFRYLEKPFDKQELVNIIRLAAQQVRLRQISSTMLAKASVEELLEQAKSAICSLVLADRVNYILINEENGKLQYDGLYLENENQPNWPPHLKDKNLISSVIEDGQILSFSDIKNELSNYKDLINDGYQSLVALPIPGEQENLGAIFVYSKEKNHFDEFGNRTILQTVVSHLGLALHNAWTDKKIEIQSKYMEALVEIGQKLTAEENPQTQLELTWKFVREQLSVTTFFVGLYDKNSDEVYFPIVFDKEKQLEIKPFSLSNQEKWGMSGYVIKTGQEVIWRDEEERLEVCRLKGIKPWAKGKDSHSCFCFPLFGEDQIIGVISIQSYASYLWSSMLLSTFRTLRNQLSVTLRITRLIENEKKHRQLERDMRETIGRLSNVSLNMDRLLDNILNELKKVITYDCATIQFYRETNKEFQIQAGRGFADIESLKEKRFSADDDDVFTQKLKGKTPVTEENGKFSRMIIPIWYGEKPLGLITLSTTKGDLSKNGYEDRALEFADHLPGLINNAKHHDEIEKNKRLLEILEETSRKLRGTIEPQKLFYDIVRQGTQLANCNFGALFIYNYHLKELLLDIPYGLNSKQEQRIKNIQFSDDNGLVGYAARSGRSATDQEKKLEPLLDELKLKSVAAYPLKYMDRVERVLVIGDTNEKIDFQHDILERFTAHAALALNISSLMDKEQRQNEQLIILREINEFIQSGKDLDKALHIVLTGITAGYGLGFNRSVLLLVNETEDGFSGKLAIGHINESDAQEDWQSSHIQNMDEFDRYIEALKMNRVEITPLEKSVQKLQIKDESRELDEFFKLLDKKNCLEVEADQLDHAQEFLEFFQPDTPMLIMPLKASGKIIGILIVDNKFTKAPFTDQDKDSLKAFANVAAVAIENNRNLERLRQAYHTARDVTKVAVLGDLGKTLFYIKERAREYLNCDIFSIYSFDEQSGKFRHCEYYGPRNEANVRKPADVKSTSTLWKTLSLSNDHPIKISDKSQEDDFFKGGFTISEEIKATLAIKLIYNEKPKGVIFINYRHPHHFEEEEIEIARMLAEQAAISIENALLFEKFKGQKDKLDLLYESGKVITSTLAIDDILQKIAEQTIKFIGSNEIKADFCNVLLAEDQKLWFKASAPKGFIPDFKQVDLTKPKAGITGRANRTGKSQIVNDVSNDPDYMVFKEKTKSELVVPLKIKKEPVGVINVESFQLNAFDKEDQDTLEALAAQASIAIQNANAHEELRKAKGVVGGQTALAWMGMASSTWWHSVSNSAQTIRDQIYLLRKDFPENNLAKFQKLNERINFIERKAKEIQVRPITPPLGSEGGVANVDINKLVKTRCARLWTKQFFTGVESELRLDLPQYYFCQISPEWLRRALDIILENAAKAVKDSPIKKIIIGTKKMDNGNLVISVRDTGPGMPEDVVAKAGYEKIEKPEDALGLGMGLLMVQTIMQAYGGYFKISDTSEKGTEVLLVMPGKYLPTEGLNG